MICIWLWDGPKFEQYSFALIFARNINQAISNSDAYAIMWPYIFRWNFGPSQGRSHNCPYKLFLEFTYAIDKSECDINQGEILEDQKISFSNKNCVTKDIKENDPGHIFYSLTLELTNNNIIVTGPEKITIECKVPNVKNVEVRQGFKANKSISFELNRCWWRMLATGCVSDSFDMLVTFYIF